MLKFVFGKASSGKTSYIVKKIKQLDLNSKSIIMLVPEQFTFESEKLLLKELGESSALNIDVLSFSRLYDVVFKKCKEQNLPILSESDKIILMNRALNSVKDKLELWSKYVGSVSFAKTMLDTIGELKINALSFEDLHKAINDSALSKNTFLVKKLKDISIVFSEYESLLKDKFIDPVNNLTKLYYMLDAEEYFKGKTVFIDSFKGFTGQQFEIIKKIISQADDVYIALTNDCRHNDEENEEHIDIFTNIRKAVKRIKEFVKTENDCQEYFLPQKTYHKGETLKALEGLMSGGEIPQFENDGSVKLFCEGDIYDEADSIARTIRGLVTEEGSKYRYRDFVIIARDAESCKDAVVTACKHNNVSCFYDNRLPLSAFPISVAVEAAIAAVNLNTNEILRFNKSGLGKLTFDQIASLENYAYLWNIEGEMWLKTWDMSPRGYDSKNVVSDEHRAELLKLNELRIKAIEPILNFKNKFHTDAKSMVKAIYELFEECSFADSLKAIAEKCGDMSSEFSVDNFKSAYEKYIDVLNSLVLCYGDMKISTAEFSENLNLAVSLATVGVIPQKLDQVAFGSADRIRPSRPRIAFIIGANHGIFPQFNQNNGIFNLSERDILIKAGINIPDNSVYTYVDEEYLVYSNLCCPTEKLYIYFSQRTISGESLEPAMFVTNISNKLSIPIISRDKFSLNYENLPMTAQTAYSEYCRNKSVSEKKAEVFSSALIGTEGEEKIKHLNDSFLNKAIEKIPTETAEMLYGTDLKIGATAFDLFHHCKFAYFLKYGLSAKKIEQNAFDARQKGNIVHFVLENLVKEHLDDISALTHNDLDIIAEKYVNEYLDQIVGYRSTENTNSRFIVSRIIRSVKDVLYHIAAEISQSEFKPTACEFEIGGENSKLDVKFDYAKGTISLVGKIDRVDEYNGKIRVIDYKTGSKKFSLADVPYGINMQMLIYLYALTRGCKLQDDAAAGVLYQPSLRNIKDGKLTMNGLLLADAEILFAMDKKGAGEFIPEPKFNKDDTLSGKNNFIVTAEGFSKIFDLIEVLMRDIGELITSGDIAIDPIDGRDSSACAYCEFAKICNNSDKKHSTVPSCSNAKALEKIEEAITNGI